MPVRGETSSAVPLDPAWLVECWIITADDKISEADAELQTFAEQLVPYVVLICFARSDHRFVLLSDPFLVL